VERAEGALVLDALGPHRAHPAGRSAAREERALELGIRHRAEVAHPRDLAALRAHDAEETEPAHAAIGPDAKAHVRRGGARAAILRALVFEDVLRVRLEVRLR